MKRAVVALMVGGVVFAAVFGMAASLGVTTEGGLGSGSSTVAACQSGTLTASFATSYDSGVPGYEVGTVTVNGLDTTSPTNCASTPFKVTLTGSGDASLGEVTGTTPASGTSFSANFASANVEAADVEGIHVVLAG